jgi:hypothetical protein
VFSTNRKAVEAESMLSRLREHTSAEHDHLLDFVTSPCGGDTPQKEARMACEQQSSASSALHREYIFPCKAGI